MAENHSSLWDIIEDRFDAANKRITLDQTLPESVARALRLLSTPGLTLTEAALARPEGGGEGSVRGRTTIWGVGGADFTLTVRGAAEAPEVRIQATLPFLSLAALGEHVLPLDPAQVARLAGVGFDEVEVQTNAAGDEMTLTGYADSWDVLGFEGLGVSSPRMILVTRSADGWRHEYGVRVLGELLLDKVRIPVELSLPVGLRGWRAGIVPPGVELPSLSDIAALFGGADVFGGLPPEVNQMTAFRLSQLDVQFDPQGPRLDTLRVTVKSANEWEVAPKLTVREVSLDLTLAAGGGKSLHADGVLAGRFNVGSLELMAVIPVPLAGTATLEARTEQPLPGLGEFAELIGDASFADALPEGLEQAGALTLRRFVVGVDLKSKRPSFFELDVLSAGEWAVIPDHLALGNIELRLRVGLSGGRATLAGFVGGSVFVGGLWVSAGVWRTSPSEGWTFGLTQPLPLPGISGLKDLVGGDFLEGFLPENMAGDVGALTVGDFSILIDNTTRRPSLITLAVTTSNPWNFVPGVFALDSLIISLKIIQPTAGTPRQLTGLIGGAVSLGGVGVWLKAEKADASKGWVFGGGLTPGSSVNLSDIIADLLPEGVTLPDEVPDLSFSDINLTVTPQTGEFTLRGTCTTQWELPFGVPGLAVGTAELDIRQAPSTGTGSQARRGPLSCSIQLGGTGPVPVVDGLVFNSFTFSFDSDGQKDWSLSGSVRAQVFDAAYTLAAGLEQTPTLRKISLRAAVSDESPLVSLGDAGSLDVSAFSISISKPLTPAAGQVSPTPSGAASSTPATPAGAGGSPPAPAEGALQVSASSPYSWEVSATASARVTNVFTLAGTLLLYQNAGVTGLVFKARDARVQIPLPVPQQSIAVNVGLRYIGVTRAAAAAGTPAAWGFDATTEVWFTGLPESLQPFFTKRVGRFKADRNETLISVAPVIDPQEFDVSIPAGGEPVGLGRALLGAPLLTLRMQGGNLSLSMDFGFGLPDKLNHVFGTRADGTPSTRFFNTYEKGKPETVTKCRLGIETVGGLTVQTVTSPVAAVRVVMEGPNAWWHVDLGEFGKAKLMVPVFSYTGDSFVARGGFEQTEPLKVPLAPFKLLLSACGLGAAADALPAGLPLEEIQLYDEGRKDFNVDEFFTTLERLGGFSLPREVRDALRFMEGRLDLLPDRFKSYLDVEIPKRFEFNIAVQPNGGASGRVWVQGDRPVKLLYPTMGLAGPQLNGVELYGLTFGEMLGGSLVFLRVDARVDQFDLLMLAAALGLPLEQLPILPSTRALNRRFIVKDLFMFIVYQAGVPVPVPLFYDELGLEYLGIEGLEFRTHWGFPKPSLSPSEALRVFNDFKRFFTEHDYLLDAGAPPQKFDLKLTVGPNYFALPEYLGGGSLGSKDDKTVISAYESLAHLLNALKTLSLNEIVRALPLDKRVGRERVKFAAMSLEIDWLVTTPQEFRQLSYRQLKVADDQIENVLQVVPAEPGEDLQGLVILLRGGWRIADAFSLATCFGIVGTGAGFATGMSVDGKLSDMLALQMSGTVVINTQGPNYFALSGHSAVTVLDHRLFTGDVQIDGEHFYLEGQLAVFPSSSPLQIGGGAKLSIDGGGRIYFRGATNVSLQDFVLQGSEITVTNTSLDVSGSWLGRTVAFGIVVEGRDFILGGSAVFDLGLKFVAGPVYEPKTGLKLTDGIKLDTRADASLAVSLGTFGFAAEIDASFEWDGLRLQVPRFRIAASPSDTRKLADAVARQISEKASEIFADVYKGVGGWLRAATADLVGLGREWEEAVAAARHWGQTAWNETAKWSTKAWQSAYRWKAGAWRATTRWSEQAWRSTAQWGDDAWEATVFWSDDAWEATTRWSDDAWRATTGWSKDAWQATTRWSAETWKDTTRWTKEVWGQTAHWTASEWDDATDTVEKFFKSIHGDVSFIPHVDTNFIPHGDVRLIPHGDVNLIPHGDVGAASHGDVKLIPHADVKLIPHGDVKLIPHADFYSIPHGDVRGEHVDVKKKKVAGVTVIPHGDSRIGHIDTPRTGHVDTPSTAHIDTPSTAHVDTPSAAHVDTPSILHVDTPSTAHVDTPSTAHVDTPATAHGDTPARAHVDTP